MPPKKAAKKAGKRKDARSLMRQKLGKETADAMLNKIDSMARKKASPSAIEKAIEEDLSKHVQKVRKDHCIPIIYSVCPDN